jgi:carboxymethylenebutenolidase
MVSPLVKTEQDRPVRVEDLAEIVMRGRRLWLTEERLVPVEAASHVGAVGFCMGGALCFSAAATIPRLGAAVPFYGIPSKATDYSKVKAPILAHFAARDTWAKPALAEALQRELAARGQPMELHVYDADHAFMNDTRPEVHHPEAARLAWDRTTAFLREHLGAGARPGAPAHVPANAL